MKSFSINSLEKKFCNLTNFQILKQLRMCIKYDKIAISSDESYQNQKESCIQKYYNKRCTFAVLNQRNK